MPIQESWVPSLTIGDKQLTANPKGMVVGVVQYFRRSDGKLICPTLPFTEAHVTNGALAIGSTQTIVTPTSGKRLWIFKVYFETNGDQRYSLKWSSGEYIKYAESAVTPAPYADYVDYLPYGLLAPAINLSFQYVNRSGASQNFTGAVLYNELDD